MQTRITENDAINEFIKIGLGEVLARDLATRYYNNEITIKDLELIKMELSNEIELVVKKDIQVLDTKIDILGKNIYEKFKLKNSSTSYNYGNRHRYSNNANYGIFIY